MWSTVFSGFCAPALRGATYGNWNSVFVRFTCWSKLGVWDAAFETLASLGTPADKEHAIDSTIVRAHPAGVKGESKSGSVRPCGAAFSAIKSHPLRCASSSDRSTAYQPLIGFSILRALWKPANLQISEHLAIWVKYPPTICPGQLSQDRLGFNFF